MTSLVSLTNKAGDNSPALPGCSYIYALRVKLANMHPSPRIRIAVVATNAGIAMSRMSCVCHGPNSTRARFPARTFSFA